MFETIMFSSCSGTTRRISASSCLISFSVSSSRVPDGALTRITNWPESVMGKNAIPSSGAIARLAANITVNAPRVTTGRATARLTMRS